MKRLLIIILILGFIGCERFEIGSVDPGYMSIYKTKQDYSEFICVSLSSVDSKVFGHPAVSYVDDEKPVSLSNDYKVKAIWLNMVYTDIKIEDWTTIKDSIDKNNINEHTYIYNRIIDFNPFSEFYIDYEKRIDYLPDTAFLNNIISKNELIKYFERVK
jgi:hypothetical protein